MSWKIELNEQRPQPTLSIRTRVAMEGLPKLIGESYMKIGEYLHELGEEPAYAPFTAFYNLDMQDLDVEMGYPVKRPLPGHDDIKSGEIPGEFVVSCMYKGPYQGMEPVYNDLFKWISDNNYKSTGVYYEYYFNAPDEVPEAELLTQVVMPVIKK